MAAEKTLSLPATVTESNANALLSQYETSIAGEGPLVLDGSAMTNFDSSVLALMLALRRRAQIGGKSLVCRNLSPNLRKLALLYGVESLV